MLHQQFYQFRSTIARNNIFLLYVPAFACQHRVDIHARRIFSNEGREEVLHLLDDALTIEIRIYQIAIVEHIGKSPISTISAIVLLQELFVFRIVDVHDEILFVSCWLLSSAESAGAIILM